MRRRRRDGPNTFASVPGGGRGRCRGPRFMFTPPPRAAADVDPALCLDSPPRRPARSGTRFDSAAGEQAFVASDHRALGTDASSARRAPVCERAVNLIDPTSSTTGADVAALAGAGLRARVLARSLNSAPAIPAMLFETPAHVPAFASTAGSHLSICSSRVHRLRAASSTRAGSGCRATSAGSRHSSSSPCLLPAGVAVGGGRALEGAVRCGSSGRRSSARRMGARSDHSSPARTPLLYDDAAPRPAVIRWAVVDEVRR